MQSNTALSAKDIALLEAACAHAKERYQEGLISIAGALRTKSGRIFTGMNLKYRTGNTNACGETMAIHLALNSGEQAFDTLVGVKYHPDSDNYEVVNACGLCRQLFAYNLPLKVIIDNNGVLEVVAAEELLKFAFI